LKRRKVIRWLGIVFLLSLALYVIPWNTVLLLSNPVPEYVPFSKEVCFPSHGGTVSYIINGTISLRARGAISADNPIDVNFSIEDAHIQDLPSVTNTRKIVVEFRGSLAFPLRWQYWYIVGTISIDVTHSPWEGSTSVVYHSSGKFDVRLTFLDSHSEQLQRADLTDIITVGPQQETFAYVTAVAFVSLDLIIIALMLLDIKDTRTDERHDSQQRYAETEP
jgi:hypothetical protein